MAVLVVKGMQEEIFESAIRTAGDLAGVFECDEETGYFYLYSIDSASGQKVVDSIHIVSGKPDFDGSQVAVRWDAAEKRVGLFIRGVLWAMFDSSNGRKLGGDYGKGPAPQLGPDAAF